MSKFISLLLLVVSLGALTIEPTFEAAHQKALRNNKILMVLLVRKEKKGDLKILQTLLSDENLCTLIKKKAVFAIIQKESKQSYPIELLYTTTYPALFVLDKNELFIHPPLTGEITAKQIEVLLR